MRDIVEGRVEIEDVLVLITRTDFDPRVDEQWQSIWDGYTSLNPEWANLDHDAVRNVVFKLWNSGRIHQPRQFGAFPTRRREFWLETVLPESELERNPAAKDAWDKFQMIAGLTNVKLDRDYS